MNSFDSEAAKTAKVLWKFLTTHNSSCIGERVCVTEGFRKKVLH